MEAFAVLALLPLLLLQFLFEVVFPLLAMVLELLFHAIAWAVRSHRKRNAILEQSRGDSPADAGRELPSKRQRTPRAFRRVVMFAGLLFAGLFGFGLLRVATDAGARRVAGEAAAKKIAPTVEKAVRAAEIAAKLPGFQKLAHLPGVRKVVEELAEYRRDPAKFLDGHAPKAAAAELPGPLKLIFPNWQKEMREHYAQVLRNLIGGVRVFLLTNVTAGLLCALWAWRARAEDAERLAAVGGLLTLAAGFALYLKFGGHAAIDVFARTRVAYWYPLVVAIVFLSAWLALQRDRKAAATNAAAS